MPDHFKTIDARGRWLGHRWPLPGVEYRLGYFVN
jgi:hypothetical protein